MPRVAQENSPPSVDGDARPAEVGPLLLVGAALFVLQWLVPMFSSLWIDELGTYWVIDGDLASTFDQASRFQGQSPLYYGLIWATAQVLGTSEFALRLPSLMAMVAAALVMFRLMRRMFGGRAALLAVATFAAIPTLPGAAADARPYALAVLAALVATDLLDRWHRSPRATLAIGYGIAAAAVVYIQYVCATILVAHAIYHVWWLRSQEDRPRAWRHTLTAAGAFLLVVAPTFPQIAALLGRRAELTFSSPVPFSSVLVVWALPPAIVVFGIVAWRLVADPRRFQPLPVNPVVLASLGFVVPPTVLFLLGHLADVVLWASRYWIVALPFAAMLIGALLASLLETEYRVSRGALAILVLALASTSSLAHSVEDWRGAVAAANEAIDDPETPVLMYSGLIEATNPDYLEDEERRSYLTAPAAYYPLEGVISPMPWSFPAEDYPDRVEPLLDSVAGASRVIVIGQRGNASYVIGWMVGRGFEVAVRASHDRVLMLAFERS